jgi:hypothetical protein
MPPLKVAIACLLAAIVFAICAAILLQSLPRPHNSMDYLVAGGVATLAALLAVFAILAATVYRSSNSFFKRRKRNPPPAS